jgi:hypothetical protein
MASFKDVFFHALAFAGVSWLVLLAGVAAMQVQTMKRMDNVCNHCAHRVARGWRRGPAAGPAIPLLATQVCGL